MREAVVAACASEVGSAPSRPVRDPLSAVLALLTLLSLGPLLVWNVAPELFPVRAHGMLAAIPLTLVALAYPIDQGVRATLASVADSCA